MAIGLWILVGLLAGVLAKWTMPRIGGERLRWRGALICGMVGGVLGGWIGSVLLGASASTGMETDNLFIAFTGAIVTLVVFRLSGGPIADAAEQFTSEPDYGEAWGKATQSLPPAPKRTTEGVKG